MLLIPIRRIERITLGITGINFSFHVDVELTRQAKQGLHFHQRIEKGYA